MEKIQLDIECQSCDGTGLYIGMAERDGAAVVCDSCGGTGLYKYSFKYKPFTARKKNKKVTRVFGNSFGYVHTTKDVPAKDGTMIKFSEAGVSYDEWLAGKEPEPVRELYCPYLWTNQRIQTKDKNGLYRTRCSKNLPLGSYISNCKCFSDKAKCWEVFERKG